MKSSAVLGDAELFNPPSATPYRRLPLPAPRSISLDGEPGLAIEPGVLEELAETAFREIAYFLRPRLLDAWAEILEDPDASPNDRRVAAALIRNAILSAGGVLPMCQDTGTAIVFAVRGDRIRTVTDDAAALAEGARRAFERNPLRYSQLLPRSMFEERNTETNLPAQVDIVRAPGAEYRLLFVAKGGGSANKTLLDQCSPALLEASAFEAYLRDRLATLGVAACPPYRLVLVVGGTSAELNLRAVKLASAGAMDGAPTEPGGAFYRDLEWEGRLLRLAQQSGWGAQFGGKYLVHETRVIRMARHAASLPIGWGVSCSADRNILARIDADGVHLEELDHHPERLAARLAEAGLRDGRRIDLNRPMDEILQQLADCRAGQLVLLNGPMVVARDRAHMRVRERLRAGHPMPEYFRRHPIYYAGPAKTPAGHVTGSFGPTTSSRMDEFMEEFLAHGAARVTLGKGQRSATVREACKRYGAFYLGTIGGAGALIAHGHIVSQELIDFADLGMEAVYRIVVRDLPAFVVYDPNGGQPWTFAVQS